MTPDYTKAFNAARDVISDYSSRTLPVDIKEIIKPYKNLRISTYSDLIIKSGLTKSELNSLVESDLGLIIRSGERHIIFYNDESKNPYLNRFTIAHELGHFFLHHLNGVKISDALSEIHHQVLEKEANCFARNLLAPIGLVKRVLSDLTICEENIN
ncbi:MAG: ImmA/IrrE family metallo-endopeptidase, partial [Clostridiales bacterium]|nr:ImmA/IrrE family metallo-endopeptidase [Clostridiales bacterium]